MVLRVGPGLDEDVRGLHITVNHPPRMRGVEGAGDLRPETETTCRRQRLALLQQRLQVRPFDVAHRDVENPVGIARVVDRDDVRVRDRGRSARLANEPLAEAFVLGKLRREQLQRDRFPSRGFSAR